MTFYWFLYKIDDILNRKSVQNVFSVTKRSAIERQFRNFQLFTATPKWIRQKNEIFFNEDF